MDKGKGKQRNLGWLIALVTISALLSSCSSHTLYLVRHAEKATTPANDPPLTEIGRKRALDLRDTLRDKAIEYLYSTDTRRTQATAQPLAEALGLEINSYKPDTSWQVARRLVRLRGNALVVGHSNTLLPLLNQLPVTHPKKTIPDDEYDNLFVVTVQKRFLRPPLIRLQEKTFGE